MPTPDKIPFLDLVTLHSELKDELSAVFSRALDTAGFIGGPMVEEFERNFAAYCTARYVVRVPDREGLMRHMAEANIGPGIHYPVPLHLQNAYEWLGYEAGDFPVTEQAAREILSLPMFPQMMPEQQNRV